MPDDPQTEISTSQETIFSGPFSTDQLIWIGSGLLLLLLLLTIRDFWFARKRWVVPFLFILRGVACAGVLLALAAPSRVTKKNTEKLKLASLGIYLDTSPSMDIRDPVDRKGHLIRWLHGSRANENKTVSAIDEALTRATVAGSVAAKLKLSPDQAEHQMPLIREQLEKTTKLVSSNQNKLPYPDLLDDIKNRLKKATEADADLITEIAEIVRRIEVVAQETARKAESDYETRDQRLSRRQLADTMLKQSVGRRTGNESGIHRYRFSDRVNSGFVGQSDSKDGKSQSDINQVLKHIEGEYLSQKIDSAFIVSDGVHNADGSGIKVPDSLKDFPLYIIPCGGDYQSNDLTLWRTSAPSMVVQGDFLSVECLVGGRGFSGKTTQVRLLEDGEIIDEVDVTFGSENDDQKVDFSTKMTASGARRFEVELVSLAGELHTDNNREFFEVSVFTGDLKVLLVDGWPRWETRYLSNLMKRDPAIEHREIIFSPEPSYTFSDDLTSDIKLANNHIVILGELGKEFLSDVELDALKSYVNNGGNLIVISGKESMPGVYRNTDLEKILPVRLDNNRIVNQQNLQLAPTPIGRRIAALNLEDDRVENDAVWRLSSSLMSLSDLSPYTIPKPGAQVILEAQPTGASRDAPIPYLIWHRYGSGRVFYFSAPTTYHLRYRFGDRYHYRFWGQFFRWATTAQLNQGNALVQAFTASKRYSESDRPKAEVELRHLDGAPVENARPIAQLTGNGLPLRKYPFVRVPGKAGVYKSELPPLESGEYRIEVTGAEVDKLKNLITADSEKGFYSPRTGFIVEAAADNENSNRTCNWEGIREILELTSGGLIPPNSLDTALEILSQNSTQSFQNHSASEPLWNRWPLFFLILLLLTVEWIGRKFAGLI